MFGPERNLPGLMKMDPERRPVSLVFSCEHGGTDVPAEYQDLFRSKAARNSLRTHRGWDEGAADLAAALSRGADAPLVVQHVTRLLVECNRSVGHPQLWSEFSRDLPEVHKQRILDRYWRPHREAVRQLVESCEPGLVIHVSVHSFSPVWHGRRRSTHIGLLYDPSRSLEARLAASWRTCLLSDAKTAHLGVHRNRPYRGWTDGLTTTLRNEFPATRYAGLELEVSQELMPASSSLMAGLATGLSEAVVML